MFKLIKRLEPEISDDDIKIGIYLYCAESYSGEHSELYKIMCEIDFKYSCTFEELENEYIDAMQARWRLHNEW